MNNININSYCEDDSFKNRSPRTTSRGGSSAGKIAKPKTEWTNNERGPTLNSKHYKLLSKKTLDSIQGMKSVNPNRLSTGSTTPSSTVKASPNIIINYPDRGLEIIVEETNSSVCSKKVENLSEPNPIKNLKPIRSNLSSASTDTIDITGNNNENSCFHEINVPKTKKRDNHLTEQKVTIHEKKHSDLHNSRHSTSIQKLLHFKTSEYSMSGSTDGHEEHASLLMPTGDGRPRNDSDCTIDYNCCSDDSTEKKAAVNDDLEVDKDVSKPVVKTAMSRRRSEDGAVEPDESCSLSQQDLKSPTGNPTKSVPIQKTMSVNGGEWCGLEDSPQRPHPDVTDPHNKVALDSPFCHTQQEHKEVGVKCSCVIC